MMRKFSKNELIAGLIGLLLIVSTLLSKKVEFFSNITYICVICLISMFIWKGIKYKDSITKVIGILGIGILLCMALLHFNINLGKIPKYIIMLFFISIVLLYTKKAYSNITICTPWLILMPISLYGITLDLLDYFYEGININGISDFIIIGILFISTWYYMINRAEPKVIEHSLKIIFGFSLICYLAINYIADFVPNEMFIQSVFNGFEETLKFGYTMKDIFNILVKTITYPLMINCIVFYFLLKNREFKLNN
jgi:hypothetical protein